MSIVTRLGGAALLAGLLAPVPVMAQAPALSSVQGAKEIADAMRSWLGRQTSNVLDWSALGLRVLPEGEHYRLEMPFGGSYFDNTLKLGDATAVATVKPLEGGRWSIVNITLPPKLRGEVRESPAAEPTVMDVTIENQQTTGVYDPSLATPSSYVTTLGGYSSETRSASGVQTSRIGKISGRSEWLPAGPGRMTIQGDSTLEDYTSISPLPGGEQTKVTIARIGGSTRIENFDIDGLGALLRTAFEVGAKAKAEGDASGTKGGSKEGAPKDAAKAPSAEDKALATRLLAQVSAMMDAMETDQTYENIRVEGGSLFSGSLRRLGFGFAAGAPGGKMEVKLRLALEGLESPLIPAGPWLEFVPHKLTLAPKLGGVPKEAVMALLRRAIDTEGREIAGDAMALLADHPVELAIEDLVIDLGPLRLKGEGTLTVSSPDEASGAAELRATGIDALIRRVNRVPELKMAAPVLIFLKGIARQEGNETVWQITYADRKMMVNDTDLSDLMPSK